MNWTNEQIEIFKEFYGSIQSGSVDRFRKMCSDFPWLKTDHTWQVITGYRPTWIKEPARSGDLEMVKAMLDLGFDINALSGKEQSSALGIAVSNGHYELAEFLLKKGANPNLSRPMIGALNQDSTKKKLAFVKLLVDNGCDVNRIYDLYGDITKGFTALDWTKDPEVVAYLKSKGAKKAVELKGESTKPATTTNVLEEVIQYFRDNFGAVDQRSIVEIVPTGFPVTVHAVRPNSNRNHLTLFTTGLSSKRMNVPSELANYALAELFIQLPADWKYETSQAQWQWPVEWLRRIAQYPHDNNTMLGGPVTIIANDDPPKPLGPNTNFTSLLLIAEKSFQRTDGETVQVYRVVPIYTDERELEIREGAPALMRAFDRHDVPFIVDLDRPSVAR
ncbi:MAG: suppressor of fused domain protein [Planctomycetota bacterium]|jgi:hypothetical protein